jgi:hypothetical protein
MGSRRRQQEKEKSVFRPAEFAGGARNLPGRSFRELQNQSEIKGLPVNPCGTWLATVGSTVCARMSGAPFDGEVTWVFSMR